ncbi:MAG: tRNA lysidine(34) synthetase TilS [Puniceicoccales bacterium]|jgi:tRNA(Ile)-lysidine synthase|nr:tRNA lysidine(34) synthetase TilS [Puniceicoccales bacterium]
MISGVNAAAHWRTGAAALAAAFPLPALDSEATTELVREAETASAHLAVACSGGVDSLAALLLVWAHFPQWRGRICILNYNHGTRPECAGESEFVRSVADALGESFHGGGPPTHPPAGEAALRTLRLAFFAKACREAGARMLVQGHQADDVVETMLMRLARGSSAAGLSAPRPVQKFSGGSVFVRPLLALPKAVLIPAMRSAGLPWCEDASNATSAYLRNRIRLTVAPQWVAAQGAPVSPGVLRSRRLLAEDNEALEAWVDVLWPHVAAAEAPGVFDWSPLAGLPPSIHRRTLWRVLAAAGIAPENFSAPAADTLVEALTAGRSGRWSADGGWLVFESASGKLVFGKDEAPATFHGTGLLVEGGTLFWPSGGVLQARTVSVSPALFAAICAGEFPPSQTVFLATPQQPLQVRFWRPGDTCRPLGAPGYRKLSDIFTDKRIPATERRRLPVVCQGEQILWVPGMPPAEECRLHATGNEALQLTWQAETNRFHSSLK